MRPEIEPDYPLSRLTTIRTGGPAEFFARTGSRRELHDVLAWAAARGLDVNVVGSGSNLLVADGGVKGLVVKLERELSRIEVRSPRVRCGGGARLPSVAARAAAAGLAGIEFGVNIPGSVGGAVRMNANAYGGALAGVLAWVEIVSADGEERRGPETLGFAYRQSNLKAGEIVARVEFSLLEAPSEEIRETLAEMRRRRHSAQPKGIRTFGSTFKNPPGQTAGLLLAQADCGGLTVGGARFTPKHANFVENTGTATTADVVALIGEARRRVRERFGVELETEVEILGSV